MMSTSTVVLTTLVAYKLVLVGIGLWARSRNRNEADFFLGGRGLGPWVAALSYAASTSSAWVILGFSGFVYAVGLSALWMVPGIWAGYAVVWLYFGRRLREESLAQDQLTLTDFLLQDAAPRQRPPVAALAAALVIGCFVFYIAAQFDAAGKALAEHFALSLAEAVVLGALIVAIYSMLGGYWAVSVTDTLQAVIMMLVAMGVPLAALAAAGRPRGGAERVGRTHAAGLPANYRRPLALGLHRFCHRRGGHVARRPRTAASAQPPDGHTGRAGTGCAASPSSSAGGWWCFSA